MLPTRRLPLLLAAALAACSNETVNHTLRIDNAVANGACTARTFTHVAATLTSGGELIAKDFTAPPGEVTTVLIDIPRTAPFSVRLSAQDGSSVWWNALTLGESGTTQILLAPGAADGNGHAYGTGSATTASGVAPDGTDIACQ